MTYFDWQEEDAAIAKDKFLVLMALAPQEVQDLGDRALEDAMDPKKLT